MTDFDESKRFSVRVIHGEGDTVFHVVDAAPPEREQPCIVMSFSLRKEPNAAFLAADFCKRHNLPLGSGARKGHGFLF